MTKKTAAWRWVLGVALAVIALGAISGTALAQDFEKVKDLPTQNVPAVRFVFLAYKIIWGAILVYVVFVARSIKRASDEIADLKRKLDRRRP